MGVNDQFVWVHLKQKVLPSEWKYKTINLPNGQVERGFSAVMKYKPQLEPQNFCYSSECCIYETTITFEFFLSGIASPTVSRFEDLKMRLCYIPKCREAKKKFIDTFNVANNSYPHTKCREDRCRAYVWCFDSCLIKMTFQDSSHSDSSKNLTKRFHLDIENGRCCYRGNEHPSAVNEITNFTEKRFLSVQDFEREVGFDFKTDVTSFVPVDIEIRARLYLFPIYHGKCYTKFEPSLGDDGCSLPWKHRDSHESHKFPAMWSEPAKKLESEFDVCFQFGSGSKPSTMQTHSFILSANSPVFRSMLSTQMSEKASGIITLSEDASVEIFQQFLGIMYEVCGFTYGSESSDSGNYGVDDSIRVLQLAHKYQVSKIFESTLDNIIGLPHSKFNSQSAINVLKAGQLYEVKDLEYRAAQWFKKELNTLDSKDAREQLKQLLSQEMSKEEIVSFVVDLIA